MRVFLVGAICLGLLLNLTTPSKAQAPRNSLAQEYGVVLRSFNATLTPIVATAWRSHTLRPALAIIVSILGCSSRSWASSRVGTFTLSRPPARKALDSSCRRRLTDCRCKHSRNTRTSTEPRVTFDAYSTHTRPFQPNGVTRSRLRATTQVLTPCAVTAAFHHTRKRRHTCNKCSVCGTVYARSCPFTRRRSRRRTRRRSGYRREACRSHKHGRARADRCSGDWNA